MESFEQDGVYLTQPPGVVKMVKVVLLIVKWEEEENQLQKLVVLLKCWFCVHIRILGSLKMAGFRLVATKVVFLSAYLEFVLLWSNVLH